MKTAEKQHQKRAILKNSYNECYCKNFQGYVNRDVYLTIWSAPFPNVKWFFLSLAIYSGTLLRLDFTSIDELIAEFDILPNYKRLP